MCKVVTEKYIDIMFGTKLNIVNLLYRRALENQIN